MGESVHLYLEDYEARNLLEHLTESVSHTQPIWMWDVRDKLKELVRVLDSRTHHDNKETK